MPPFWRCSSLLYRRAVASRKPASTGGKRGPDPPCGLARRRQLCWFRGGSGEEYRGVHGWTADQPRQPRSEDLPEGRVAGDAPKDPSGHADEPHARVLMLLQPALSPASARLETPLEAPACRTNSPVLCHTHANT